MTTRDLERDLAAVLHRRAEDAMNSTDTQAEHDRFYEVLESEPRGERPRWLVGLVAAAAAVAVTSAIWTVVPDDRDLEPAPAPGEGPGREAVAEVLGDQAVAAFLDGDRDEVNALTRVGAWDGLDQELLFAETWLFDYDVAPCATSATTYVAVVVTCDATLDAAYSVELGRGRFDDIRFTFVVREREIIDGGLILNYETNGLGDYLAAVSGWIADNADPGDRALVTTQSPELLSRSDQARYVTLMRQYLEAYRDDVTSRGGG